MSPKEEAKEEIPVFTQADRNLLHRTADMTSDIHEFLFGGPKATKLSFVIQVERNTIFRKVASVILLALVPTVVMILYHLISNKGAH